MWRLLLVTESALKQFGAAICLRGISKKTPFTQHKIFQKKNKKTFIFKLLGYLIIFSANIFKTMGLATYK